MTARRKFPEDVHRLEGVIPDTLEETTRDLILVTLYHFNGKRGSAARSLNINRRTLARKLDDYRDEGHIVPPFNCWGATG